MPDELGVPDDDEAEDESSPVFAGGDPDEDDVLDAEVPEVLFEDVPDVAPRLSVTGLVWKESKRPSPAAVPAMTKGARLIGRPPFLNAVR